MAWTYSRAVEYAEGKAVSLPGLQRINALMKALGDPQDRYLRVHVAGTNGKGSVSAYIAGILTAAGYKTGRFSSPAVIDRKECITVDGEQISELEYAYCMERVAAASGEDRPTSFEAETAAALLYFAYKGCRFAVLEAGMGGAQDATNVHGKKAAAAITSVGLDHTEFLGDTLQKITLAKAGIFDGAEQCYSALQDKVHFRAAAKRRGIQRKQAACRVRWAHIEHNARDKSACKRRACDRGVQGAEQSGVLHTRGRDIRRTRRGPSLPSGADRRKTSP